MAARTTDAPQTSDKTIGVTTASQESYAAGSNALISSMRDSQSNSNASKSLPKVEVFDGGQTTKNAVPQSGSDNKTPLSYADVHKEASKLDPMVKQFLASNNYDTQKNAITNIQNELQTLIPHGFDSTTQVLDQVASDLKNDKSVNADIQTNVLISPNTASIGVINHKTTPGLPENGPTGLSIYSTPDLLLTAGNDGNATNLSVSSSVKNGIAGTPTDKFSPTPIAPKPAPTFSIAAILSDL